uniref:CARD domain-containing protein n=1 Tax=Photinus pyralis TaxID=7054 RepID=A0A1Y1N3Z0_PHOPY
MDDSKRLILKEQWDKIVKDLYVEHILDELYSLGTINNHELETIRNKNTRADAVESLLKYVVKKDNRAFDNFKSVLKKDYDWLSVALQENHDQNDLHVTTEQLAFQDSLVLGNVPRQPPYYVRRTIPLQNLQLHLEELEPCQRIILYGMTGSGKSCLAAAAVKDPDLLHHYFRNRVFWINLGEVKEVDQLPVHMTLLLERLQNDSRQKTEKLRPVSIPPSHDDSSFEIEVLKHSLKNMFTNFREALLILDNVLLREATEAFDVGCKTLITTQVKDIIVGNNSVYVKVEGGFTQKETLELFAKSLNTEVKKLPVLAEKLHNLCKGEPILISLIGTLFEPCKEDLLNSLKSWHYYIKKLTNKDYNLKRQLFDTISICIERLSPEMQKLYFKFSVFVEDVNITPQVMQIIWNLDDLHDVHEKMQELQNKSLIVSYYNQELKTYVYGVHDLFLAYLKEKLSADALVAQHKQLISSYKRVSNDNFANLPNDNYIYQYLGYHLKHAQCYNEFSVYFDLKFIGAKIKAIGTADLLRDYQLYKNYITRNDEVLLKKLGEYINFVKARGHDLYKYSDMDIIQCGLGQPKDSSIYNAALVLAKEQPQSLYLQLQSSQENVYFTHTLDLQQDVSAACFTCDVDQILVGMKNGDINLWEQSRNHKLYVFPGHTDTILHLRFCPDGNGFLSVSEDGCVKIWNLDGVVLRNSNGEIYDENGFNDHIPSPRTKQSYWQNFYENNRQDRIDRSKTCRISKDGQLDKVICAAYANHSKNDIVTGCFSGNVFVWNVAEEPVVVCTIHGRGTPVSCVTFSGDDSLIIFCCDSIIFIYNAKNGEYLSQLLNRVTINSLLIVPDYDSALIAINKNTITMWTWNQSGLNITDPSMKELDNRQTNYLCGAVTDDGMYLVAGSTDHYIRIWNISTAKTIQEILNNKGLVVCLDTFYDDSKKAVHILLSGSDDQTVKQWHIQPTTPTKDTPKLLPIFDCYWNATSGIPRIAVVNTANKVQIMNGFNLIIESETLPAKINVVRFSLCGNKIAIGLISGDVIEFDYKNRHSETLMKLHDSVVFLKYFSTVHPSLQEKHAKNLPSTCYVLVGAAKNGWITMFVADRAVCLMQPPYLTEFSNNKLPVIPIVQCFYIKKFNKLLSVAKNRVIKLWDEDASYTILFGEKTQKSGSNGVVTMATISSDQSNLAITFDNGCFEIYSVAESENSFTLNEERLWERPLRCCRFSHNGKILALGDDNGNIVIWSVESKTILGTLQLHKSSVRYLLFSPSPALILISVGDQIAWWDLTKLSDNNLNRYRRRSSSVKRRNLAIDLSAPMTNLNLSVWSNKEGKTEKPHLLSVIKVRGVFSTYISASYDFTSFFSIDQNGYPYIMEVL